MERYEFSSELSAAIKTAAVLCREYRTACVEQAHYFKLYNWHLNQLKKVSERLESRRTDLAIELDLFLRDMLSLESTCICDLREIVSKKGVKCRRTGPSRTILDKETNRFKKKYQEARDRSRLASNALFLFLYNDLYGKFCICNKKESNENNG